MRFHIVEPPLVHPFRTFLFFFGISPGVAVDASEDLVGCFCIPVRPYLFIGCFILFVYQACFSGLSVAFLFSLVSFESAVGAYLSDVVPLLARRFPIYSLRVIFSGCLVVFVNRHMCSSCVLATDAPFCNMFLNDVVFVEFMIAMLFSIL